MRFFLFSLVTLITLSEAVPVAAQPVVPAIRTVRFVGTENLPAGLLIKQGSSWVAVNAPLFAAGEPLVLTDARSLEFYVEQRLADPASPSPHRVLVGRGTLPGSMETALVVLLAGEPDKDGLFLRAFVYDSSVKGGYGDQSLRVINLLNMPVAMQMDAGVLELSPGEARSVNPKLDRRYRSLFRLARKDAGQWTLIKNGLISISPKSRVTLLAIYSATGMAHLMTAGELAQFGGRPPPGFFVITVAESVPASAVESP